MLLSQKLAGFTKGEADVLRKAMGKKQKDVLDKMKPKFVEQASAKGHDATVLEKIWKDWEAFASYAFNKSHSTCYAWIAYQTAYLKTYYPVELYTANLNNRIEISDEIAKYTMSAKEREIELLPPSINKSDTYFTVENSKIRFGLASLKNVGVQLVNDIVNERNENGEFSDIADFIKRTNTTGVNKRAIEAFILSGAFDEFNHTRSQLMAVYESIVDRVQSDKKNQDNGQLSMFDTLLKNDNSLYLFNILNFMK